MRDIHDEDVCNDTYGRKRMHQALLLKQPEGVDIPSERTVYRVMKEIGLVHHPRRRPNGITRADREARKSDDLLKRDFSAEKSLETCVIDITERKAKDGRLYVSAIFDCFDLTVLGLSMDDNMRAELCVRTMDSAAASYPALRGAIVHSDRGSQYTSGAYRAAVEKHGICQSMNSGGGRCRDNARCESIWVRMKRMCQLILTRSAGPCRGIEPPKICVKENKRHPFNQESEQERNLIRPLAKIKSSE